MRFLNPGCAKELYNFFILMSPDTQQPLFSESTFRRCWKGWRKYLKFRAEGTHARCSTCAELLACVQAEPKSSEERVEATLKYRNHIRQVLRDRQLDTRLDGLIELAISSSSCPEALKIDIDAMDQAKFKVPRNLCSSKLWESCWRPRIHCFSIIIAGLLEVFVLQDELVSKGSNNEISLIVKAISLAKAELDRLGLPMPAHLPLRVLPMQCSFRGGGGGFGSRGLQ